MVAPRNVAARTSGVRNDRQQEMRWMLGVVIDPVQHGLAAADVIRDVLDIGGAAHAGRDVEAGDLDADAVTLLELVGGRHELVCRLLLETKKPLMVPLGSAPCSSRKYASFSLATT